MNRIANEQNIFCIGDIVRHFKYETLTEEEKLKIIIHI